MSKRLMSLICSVIILISAVIPTVIFSVTAEGLAAGSYPYPNGKDNSVIIRNVKDGEIKAYSDFIAKSTLDDLTDSNYLNTWRLYNKSASVYKVGSNTLATATLEKYSANLDNVYSNSGNSIKISYTKTCNSKITPANGSADQYFHYIRQNNYFSVPSDYLETASVSFWVKTKHQTYVILRLTCNGYDTKDFIVSERILVPAGESIVEIPLSNFITANNGYTAIHQSGSFKVNIADIYFKATETFEGTRDIYFDNLGFNYYTSNSKKELHSEGFALKNALEGLTYSFDENRDKVVDSNGITWRDDEKGNLGVTNDAGNVYNGAGSSIYYTTDSIFSSESANCVTNNESYSTRMNGEKIGKDAVVCIWLKSDRALKMYIRALDSSWDKNRYRSSEYFVPAGEFVLKIPLSDLNIQDSASIACDFSFKWDAFNSLGLYFKSATQTSITGKEAKVYIDKIGIEKGETVEPEEPEKPEVPNTVATHSEDFKEIETIAEKWINKKSENATLSIENEAEHYHSLATNVPQNKSAIKVAYTNLDSTASNVRFYYENRLSISEIAPFIYDEDSVISFWVWSDQSVNVKVTYMDFDSVTQKSVQCDTKVITLPAGESIVKIPMSEMAKNGQELAYKYAYQLQFIIVSNEESVTDNGTVFIDAIGFYDKDTTNNIPYIPENIIPDTVATHEIGFSEVALDNSLWVNKKGETSAFSVETNSEHYHSGKTNVGLNKEAWKLSYTNLSATASNVNFYYNSGIKISNSDPYIFGDASVLSFWTYSEQPVDLKINYMDYSIDAGKSILCKPITVSIPAGESIVKIPMNDLAVDGNQMQYRHCYQLQFIVLANKDSYKAESTLWLDAIGFYDSSLVINDKPLTVPEDTYIWWNFDKDDTVEELNGEWTTRFEGEDKKGISLSIEKNSENTYGGKGNSLKIVYDRKLGYNGIPCIWHEDRMTAYGDGLVFWLKSEEKTNIRLVCLDASYDGVKSPSIPITIGYNIITVKWSDFEYLDAKMTGKPEMSNVSQLQIRPNGCNNGTFWLDQIGFSNVENDGSNSYYSLYPPTEYKKWYDGVSVVGDNFDAWPGDDDMKFCSEWYFDETGWISLAKNDNNAILQMDYDFSNGKKSELINITQFKEVDPNGGISFWAKSSEERYYTVKLWLAERTISVIIKGSKEGRYYKIPFSSFWLSNKTGTSFVAEDKAAVTVQRLSIITDSTCNPPAMNASDKCTLWIDDIKFVDSADYKRAAAVDHYENGVCLKAPIEAFNTGITVKVEKNSVEDKKDEYLPKMAGAVKVGSLYKIEAIDTRGISVTPKVEVELIFDVPEGEKAEDVIIYQRFLDGSLSKRKSTIGDDGKVHLAVYRLGEYLMGFGDGVVKESVKVEEPQQEETTKAPLVPIVIAVGVVIIAGAVVAGIFVFRKRGAKK